MRLRTWSNCVVLLLAGAVAAGCAGDSHAEPRFTVAAADVQGGEWFEQTGCTTCHSITVYGIRNLAATAPDLSVAVEDVPRRFGRTLDDFLQAPTGTMAMVLSSRIPLTPDQRALAIEKLKDAYREHQSALGAARPVASH
jgi:hypothetical protein